MVSPNNKITGNKCANIFFFIVVFIVWVGILTSPSLIRLKFVANLENTDVRHTFTTTENI